MQGLDEGERSQWQYDEAGRAVRYVRRSILQARQPPAPLASKQGRGSYGSGFEDIEDGSVDIVQKDKR